MAQNGVLTIQDERLLEKTFSDAMARVYLWMAGGLLVTAVVAMLVAQSESITAAVFGRWYIYIGLFVAQVILVVTISGGINKLAPATALGLFFLYSGLMGLTLSVVLLVHDLGTIGQALGGTCATFTAMSIVGLTTKKDLTGWGPILLASLFGLIIASLANWFFQSSVLAWVVSLAGVLIFMGLTVYDSKEIKTMTSEALGDGDALAVKSIGVLGALTLYLDFVNMFLFILSLLGEGDG